METTRYDAENGLLTVPYCAFKIAQDGGMDVFLLANRRTKLFGLLLYFSKHR